jgi:hypothetical protein
MKRALAFLVPAILALPAQSLAVSPKSPQEQQAMKLAREASMALDAGRKEEAADKLRQAFRLHQLPDFPCILGKIELDLGHGSKAAEALHTCLKILPMTDVVLRYRIEGGYSRAKALSGTLRVRANIEEADVILGGKSLGKTPLNEPAFVDPGRHLVEVRAPGYAPELRVVDLPAGSEIDLDITLKPAELTAPPLPAKTSTPLPTLPRATAPARPPPAPPRAAVPHGFVVRPAFLLTGLGLATAGIAAGAGTLVASAATESEARAMNLALTDKSALICTAPENGRACADLSDRVDSVIAFKVVGFTSIALATIGSGMVAYELLRAEAIRSVIMGAAVVGAPNGGMFTIHGAW